MGGVCKSVPMPNLKYDLDAMRDAVTALRNVIESKSITGNCVIPASQLELSGTVAW